MVWTVFRSVFVLCCLFGTITAPAEAHVKWFLTSSEADLLRQPKPELFASPSIWNIVPLCLWLAAVVVTTIYGREWAKARLNRMLISFAEKKEAYINLFIRLCAGISLIHSAALSQLFAPNFEICAHCPQWLPLAEFTVGYALMLGLGTRIASLGFLYLLAFTFLKHPVADCLDLIPLYGVAIYCFISGADRFSLDSLISGKQASNLFTQNLAHLAIRWGLGLGLIVLSLDEKLLHPQLALNILQKVPELNFMHSLYFGNDLFVLCAGLAELAFGLMLLVGSFPRLATLLLAATMFATTTLFGSSEFFGHAPYYGIALSILLRGGGSSYLVESLKRRLSVITVRTQRISVELVSQKL